MSGRLKQQYAWSSINDTKHLRYLAVKRLGARCASKDCRYLNSEDNTLGCANWFLLHIDHIAGNGHEERKRMHNGAIYKRILQMGKPEQEYQILCANCNWLKKLMNNEYRYVKARKPQ